MKRTLDVLASLMALGLLCVPLLLLALLVAITSKGPVLYWSDRVGQHNRIFRMPKLRTMRVGTPSVATHLLDNPQAHLTPVGGFLRRTSLDEFPQLLNVLLGQMSLVGPRPLPIYEVDNFEMTAHRRRLSMKPGLTCLWQIAGRNIVKDFSEWVKLDVQYIDNWSLWLDLKILLKTVPIVLLGRGAH